METITLETPSLGDRSYVVHDGKSALVVDPQRDVDRILEVVENAGVTITHIVETHVHNDYLTGGLVLSRMTGATYVHAEAEPLRFEHTPVSGGDRFEVGELSVEVLHSPGHTPNHLSYVVRHGEEPPAAFTGGSLLYGSVGRTDLVSEEMTDELTRDQFRSARELADKLPGETNVYPTHGFGSFCSSTSSESDSDGTLANEREINVALTIDDEEDFVERLVSGLTAHPRYYAHMSPMNLAGPVPIDLSPPAEVDPVELARRIHRGDWVIDLRERRLFAAEHLTGTIGIELDDPFATYVGWLIPWGTPITLLGDEVEQVAEAQVQLSRIGIDRPSGASVADGPSSWAPDHDRSAYDVVDFGGAVDADGVILDVRRDDERNESHIDGSIHVPIHELLSRLDELPSDTLWVHCETGFRASIAASLLDRSGRAVVLIDDQYENAADTELPIVEA